MSHKLDHAAAVYDAQTLLGFVVEVKPSRWAVYDAEQRFLGEHPSRAAALDALCQKTENNRAPAATGARHRRR
jgi:hypothetical protein